MTEGPYQEGREIDVSYPRGPEDWADFTLASTRFAWSCWKFRTSAGPRAIVGVTKTVTFDAHPRSSLIVALDFDSLSSAMKFAKQVADVVGLFKIGSQLFYFPLVPQR